MARLALLTGSILIDSTFSRKEINWLGFFIQGEWYKNVLYVSEFQTRYLFFPFPWPTDVKKRKKRGSMDYIIFSVCMRGCIRCIYMQNG